MSRTPEGPEGPAPWDRDEHNGDVPDGEQGIRAPREGAGQPDEGLDPVPFDPTGLDLARRIADMVRHTAPLPEPRPRPKPRTPRPPAGKRGKDGPQPLGEALDSVIRAQGWSTELSVHSLLGRWAALVGPAVAEHSRPEGFAAGVITVRTDSTAWASQLRLMTPQLLAKINAELGQGTVRRIQVQGPDAPSWKHGRRSVRDGRGPRDTYG